MFKSMEEPEGVQGSFWATESEVENAIAVPGTVPGRTPINARQATPSRFSRRALGRARHQRLVRNLNRSLAIVEDEGFSLSGGCLTALDGALSGFLAEARLQHAGSSGSSRGPAGPSRGGTTSSARPSTKTLSADDMEKRVRARADSKNSRKGGKPNG